MAEIIVLQCDVCGARSGDVKVTRWTASSQSGSKKFADLCTDCAPKVFAKFHDGAAKKPRRTFQVYDA